MIPPLPRALEPWRGALEELVPELALGLAPMIRRIALALGPLRAERREPSAEPDGYGGIGRRGSYERLLSGEWLLATELPDEFLRRASAGEHLFLELARSAPAGGGALLALVDCGPAQLGTPRIAQLAALVVLAARAERAGATFSWGVLQQPDGAPVAGLQPASVLTLLRARTALAATRAHADAWGARGVARDADVWVLGGEPLARQAIVFRDLYEPGTRKVTVEIRREGRRAAELVLDLPPDPICTQLVRDPYRAQAAPLPARRGPLPGSPTGRPVLSVDGRRVMVKLTTGGLAALAVPLSSRGGLARPLTYNAPPGDEIIAAGRFGNRLWIVTWREADRTFGVEALGKRGGRAEHHRLKSQVDRPLTGGLLLACSLGSGAARVTFTDEAGRAFGLVPAVTVRSAERPGDVLRAPWNNFLSAWRVGAGWEIRDQRGTVLHTLTPSGHDEVVAFAPHTAPNLLLLEDQRRALTLVSREKSETIARSPTPIVGTAAGWGGLVAYVTEDARLVVVREGTVVLREPAS